MEYWVWLCYKCAFGGIFATISTFVRCFPAFSAHGEMGGTRVMHIEALGFWKKHPPS